MRLTKKKSIKLSIEHWEWLAETGKLKEDWPEWDKYGGLNKFNYCENVTAFCFLCEYSKYFSCEDKCPYCIKFGNCCAASSPFSKWDVVESQQTRKKYAKEFLEQLKQLQ